jgi:hypothetical protein
MEPMTADVDKPADGRMLFPIEHHPDDLIQRTDCRQRNQQAEKPFESTHGDMITCHGWKKQTGTSRSVAQDRASGTPNEHLCPRVRGLPSRQAFSALQTE